MRLDKAVVGDVVATRIAYGNGASTHSRRINPISLSAKPLCSPATAAGVTKRLWEIGDIVDMLEAWEQSGCARG